MGSGKEKDLYDEDLVWMSYRYAIGLKPEREDDYFNVDFNSPEYHALVSEFREFLKKKKIENVSDILIKNRKDDLVYLSYHYACGSRSYASLHAGEIAKHAYSTMSNERRKFISQDIRREIYSHLGFMWCNFRCSYDIMGKYDPIDIFMKFIEDCHVVNKKQLYGYTLIEPVIDSDGIKFITEWDGTKVENENNFYPYEVDDYLCWADLASCFDEDKLSVCVVKYDGKEEKIVYFESWVRDYDGRITYEDVKTKVIEMLDKHCISSENINKENTKYLIKEAERFYDVPDYADDLYDVYYYDVKDVSSLSAKIWKVYLDTIHPENLLKYKKIKRPLNLYLKNPYIVEYINEEYIIKDNLKPEKND